MGNIGCGSSVRRPTLPSGVRSSKGLSDLAVLRERAPDLALGEWDKTD